MPVGVCQPPVQILQIGGTAEAGQMGCEVMRPWLRLVDRYSIICYYILSSSTGGTMYSIAGYMAMVNSRIYIYSYIYVFYLMEPKGPYGY